MINLCPNCGVEIEDNAKFCPNCGKPIDGFPLGYEPKVGEANGEVQQADNYGFGESYTQQHVVATTIEPNKANKYLKSIITMSILVLIGSLLGFIVNLIDMGDVLSLQEDIDYGWSHGFLGYSKAASALVNTYFVLIVLLALLVAAAVVYVVFATKLKKFNFPVYNDDVFGATKKVFYASIAPTVIFGVLCIVEIVFIAQFIEVQMEIKKLLGEADFNIAMNVGFMIKDFVIWGCTVVAMIYALKLSKCKQNDTPIGM